MKALADALSVLVLGFSAAAVIEIGFYWIKARMPK